jgi:DNA-directed RNA polymerase subunit RPC12/RpoP
VFAHSFKCRRCTLHFVLFSWALGRHRPATIHCPECGSTGAFMHRIAQLSASRTFSFAPDREPEIYDVWPFRLGTA